MLIVNWDVCNLSLNALNVSAWCRKGDDIVSFCRVHLQSDGITFDFAIVTVSNDIFTGCGERDLLHGDCNILANYYHQGKCMNFLLVNLVYTAAKCWQEFIDIFGKGQKLVKCCLAGISRIVFWGVRVFVGGWVTEIDLKWADFTKFCGICGGFSQTKLPSHMLPSVGNVCTLLFLTVLSSRQGGDTPYTLARRFLSTRERRHVPSHVPFQQRHMTTQVTLFNMARPSWPNPSSAIAQGYVVSTHKRCDNLRCVKEIHELVIRKVSAQFSTWRGPLGRIHRVQWSTAMLSVHTNTVTICDL